MPAYTPACIVAPDQWAHYSELAASVRNDLDRKLDLLSPVMAMERGHCRALAAIAAQSGRSFQTLYRWYKAAERGDWMALAEKRTDSKLWVRTAAIGLPASDVELLRTYCEQNQRKLRPAVRAMLRDWRSGKIATTQPIDIRTGEPVGWSFGNLRQHAPTKYEQKVSRTGRGAAFDLRPTVLSTRVGLSFGKYFLFDDDEYDLETTFLGVSTRVMRPLGLSAIEALSACHCDVSFKPCLWDEDEQKKKKLLQRDMRLLAAHHLIHVGYRADGTVFIWEHGTANTGKEFTDRITAVTNGAVTIERSGMEGKQAHAAIFDGRSRGNFRFKALRESMGNLVRNEMADQLTFPGQVGKDRLACPESTWGSRRYTEALLKAATQLPAELAQTLQYPRLDWPTFVRLANALYDRVDRRGEESADGHDLEGWLKLGFVAREFRLDPASQEWLPWSRALALPEAQRSTVEALVAQEPLCWRTRKLSPREVWNRNEAQLIRLPASALVVLLPEPDYWQMITVRDDHTVALTPERGADPITYQAQLPDGSWVRPQTQLRAWVLPGADGTLPVADEQGRWLGELPVIARVCRSDRDAVARAMGVAKKAEHSLLAPLVRRASEQLRETAAMRLHNAGVLDAADGGPERRAEQAALIAKRAGEAEAVPHTDSNDWL